VRLLGAVAEPYRPQAGVVEVVRDLLAGLAGDGGEPGVGAPAQRGVERQLVRRQEQQLGDGDREVAVRQFDQQSVAELPVVAQVRQRVLVPARPLQFAGVRQQQSGGAELVQGDVGQRDVLLQLRRGGHPLAEPLRGDQRVVAEPQQVRHRGLRGYVGRVHRCAAPSGTS
jgi:hypothetical protein